MPQSPRIDKLMDLCDHDAEKIAEQWYNDLISNQRTTTFRSNPKDSCLRHATFIYKNLRKMYSADSPFKEVMWALDTEGFAEEQYGRSIPLSEAIYALILMRRHIWLYADAAALFNSPGDMYLALQSNNRILLLFDYAIYIITQKYERMARHLSPNLNL